MPFKFSTLVNMNAPHDVMLSFTIKPFRLIKCCARNTKMRAIGESYQERNDIKYFVLRSVCIK